MATGYSVAAYGEMVTNTPRMSAYDAALRQAITPGCTVLDIGAGPGIFALLACKYGAGHVYAIDPDPSIEIARQSAIDNGFADRITFVKDLSTAFTPPRKADVIVSDLRSVLPLFEYHIPTVVDARARLLTPEAAMIPRADTIHAAMVESAEAAQYHHEPWAVNGFDLDLQAGHRFAVSVWRRGQFRPEALLTDPQVFTRLDYRTITEVNQRATLDWVARRPGTAHGLILWFDADLAEGIGFSNAPGAPKLIYGQAFFPLAAPVALAEGDRITADISATFMEGKYIWSWTTQLAPADAPAPVARMRQSTFQAKVFEHDRLVLSNPAYCPPRRESQAIDAFILARFDGQTDLATIAAALRRSWPARFADDTAAREHVSGVAARYHA